MKVERRRTLLLASVSAIAVASIYVAQPVLTQIGRDLAVPEAALGWIVAAGQGGYLLGLLLIVPLGDTLDRRRLITVQLLLVATGVSVVAASSVLWVTLVGLACTGLSAVVVQVAVALAADLSTPADRGRALGVVTSGVIIGILGARVLAGALAALWGWRSIYVVLAVLLVLLAMAALQGLPAEQRSRPKAPVRPLASFAHLLREPLFVSRGLIAFFLFASFGTLWSGLALPLSAGPWGLSPMQVGAFGIAGLAGALGAARAGRWADAGRADAVTGGALALLAASWIASAQANWSLWLVVVGIVLLDFAVQVAHVSSQTLLTATHPDRTSTVIGGYMVFYSTGSAVGATVTTTAYASAGWAGSAVLGACFATGGLVTWAISRRAAAGV